MLEKDKKRLDRTIPSLILKTGILGIGLYAFMFGTGRVLWT
jgi:hypothetical protein